MADNKIDPLDIGALERAVNDSAGRVSGIWLSFVAFSAYLAAAASMISHRQMFLEEPIKLPTVNIDLPLFASAILLPLLFVIYHTFVLLQVVLLARTADAYNDAIEHGVTEGIDRTRVRQRLANTLFAQLFAGSPREREGVLGWLLTFMSWITLAIAPVCVLLVFQLKFLPYHSDFVTWTQRGLLALDLMAVLLLWAGAINARRDIALRLVLRDWKATTLGGIVVLVSLLGLTFPSEPHRQGLQTLLFGPDAGCRLPNWMGPKPALDRLYLSGEIFVDPDKVTKIEATAKASGLRAYQSERTHHFQDRDFSCASFGGADIRLADFSGARLLDTDLTGADLRGVQFMNAALRRALLGGAKLQGASFDGADLRGAHLRSANLNGASFESVPRDNSYAPVQAQKVNFENAELQQARLSEAVLDGSRLGGANLQGANLVNASLRNADLTSANLQGAILTNAVLQNADLKWAQMQGAWLVSANLQGAFLDEAELQGAALGAAKLQSTTLTHTYLQGANMGGAQLQGALLGGAQLQGTLLENTDFTWAHMPGVFVWRSGVVRCDGGRVTAPVFEPVAGRWHYGDMEKPSEIKPLDIKSVIEQAVRDVPEGSLNKYSSRKGVADSMSGLFAGRKPEAAEKDLQAWRDCETRALSMSEQDYAKGVTAYLIGFACGPDPEYPQAAEAVYRSWIDRDDWVKFDRSELARGLLGLDGKPCPGAEGLDDYYREALRKIAASPPAR
jgi:uncharacterized protein YjbI with pentapeptide repeats